MDEMSAPAANDLEAAHQAELRAIAAGNDDLGERARELGVTVTYDREDDLLTLTLGPAREAVTESVDNTLYVRVNPETRKILGFEVSGVREFGVDRAYLDLFFDALSIPGAKFELVPDAGGSDPERHFADVFKELVKP
jgi:hypothetical protein